MTHFTLHPQTATILKEQVLSNYPHECGGYLAGQGNEITGVYPVKNIQNFHNRTSTFSLPQGSFPKAKIYFDSHGLTYLGVYHSHPNGGLMPSAADRANAMPHRDRLQIIIGTDGYSMDLAIYDTKTYQRHSVEIG